MKKDWKYILYLSLAFGIFLIVKLTGPKQFDWTPTYAPEDKNPYGAFVLWQILPDLFKERELVVSNLTVYELKDSLEADENVIILSHTFTGEKADTEALLKHVENGGSVFISAESFYGKFADTLKIATYDYLFRNGLNEIQRDSSYVKFTNRTLDTTRHFAFKRENIHNYFGKFDTTRTTVIAENDMHQPVTIRMAWGKGNFILNCIPLAFTNIYTLQGGTHEFVANSLSYLPQKDSHWTEYYSVGRMEAETPLRFVLTHEPLAWAYYISITSLLIFMLYESKRKQRIIPIIKPLENTSLEFVATIGTLYYQRSDHKNIAEKKITFFFEQIRTRYLLNPTSAGENFISLLSRKVGKGEVEIRTLVELIARIQKQTSITENDLRELNKLIEKFWGYG
ncbi:DUF4350 domain-containing protein [soil metagenome]